MIAASRRHWLLPALVVAILALPRLWPQPPLASWVSSSRSVSAAGGELLRLTLTSDEQYRLWTPLADIAPSLTEAVLLYEDRWFRWHPGVNPWALMRAAVATATGRRRIGGSTITMQLARRIYDIDSRSIGGKLRQAFAALWLEWRYSKDAILEAYLSLAPYGGNVEGVGAASLILMRKPARQLSVAEALNLAVIPQNPRRRIGKVGDGGDGGTPELDAARTRLARIWVERHPADRHLAAPGALRVAFASRARLPFRAPHLAEMLLRTRTEREIVASLHLPTQDVVERVVAEYLKARAGSGLDNATAILVDTSTMQVKAYVGSADHRNDKIAGQVNGILARRSPGSTLKPFLYALALDQGLIHSATILRDAPSSFGGFSPENFDGRFSGPIRAADALVRSRNVPAVDLAAHLGRPNLYDFLARAGVRKLAPETHYGLALALGGGELSAEELVGLYALLANRGVWQELRYDQRPAAGSPLRLISDAAALITLDILRQSPRPDTQVPARPPVAWKTGTSWGFRDAWTAGVFGRHALVVWVGHFDGSSNPALIGIEAAAPLFLRIVDALRAEHLDPGEIAAASPADLIRVEVCTASGDLPNADCPARSPAWFIAGKSPIRQSTLHRRVLVDRRSGRLACRPGPDTREEVYEYWPSEYRELFRRAGLPRREPPAGTCDNTLPADSAPRIVSPLRGVTHLRRLHRADAIMLRSEAVSAGKLHWFADDALLGSARPGEALAWVPPRAGSFVLRVVDAEGRADSRSLVVEDAE